MLLEQVIVMKKESFTSDAENKSNKNTASLEAADFQNSITEIFSMGSYLLFIIFLFSMKLL